MPITKQTLIEMSSPSVYQRGLNYYREKRVHILDVNENYVMAVVDGQNSARYSVWIERSADRNSLDSYECDCPAFASGNGPCKHIVATVLAMQDTKPVLSRQSDRGSVEMLNLYFQSVADKALENHEGTAVLEPILNYTKAGEIWLTFRVGEKRMYVIPSLDQFSEHIRRRETAVYGSKFELHHAPFSFCKESRPLLEFFLRRFDSDNNYYYKRQNYFYSHYYSPPDKRKMYLSTQMTDEFFTLMEGRIFSVREDGQRTRAVSVRQEEFRPKLELNQEMGGVSLRLKEPCLPIQGEKKLYVLTENELFCCEEPFQRSCAAMLELLTQNDGTLFFAKEHLGGLFSTVIPQIEPFVELKRSASLDRYQPEPLETKIYLDTSGPDSVTARMTFTYGKNVIPAFGPKGALEARNIAEELRAESLLSSYLGTDLYPDQTLRIQDNPDAVFRLISEGLDELSQIGELYTTNSFQNFRLHPHTSVTVGVHVNSGLLEMDFDLEGLDLSELPGILNAYQVRKKYHRLRDGSFLTLEGSALSTLSELAEGLDLSDQQLAGGHAELALSRALYLDAVCKQNNGLNFERDRTFKHILRDMEAIENADFPIPDSLNRTLRNYQKTGFQWLKTITAYGFGGILADDMGLGKTLQVLALLQSYYKEPGEKLPSIVVCPSSLCLNWESEVQKFTPNRLVRMISGPAAQRAKLIGGAADGELLITSYDLLKRDVKQYKELQFAFIILDEAQYIKNQATQNARAVKTLRGRTRLALTGTPVENSLAELWSIFDFLMPGYLLAYSRFRKKYEEPIVKESAQDVSERLKQLVRPFLLRRLKKEVLTELPPKTESTLLLSMGNEQRQVYAATLASVKKKVQEDLDKEHQGMAILAALTRLRQICCDPSLLFENYAGGSTKLDGCMELIQNCIESGHRILLFSQFTSMLDILGRQLDERNVTWLRIDGSTRPDRRLDLVKQFNVGTDPVFLISLKAGGTGLNLTGADVVIHYDPWWNLSAQNQAADRVHRIGQKNRVQVYKLIAKGTIEERILALQERKAELANTVITENSNPIERLNREELLALLDV